MERILDKILDKILLEFEINGHDEFRVIAQYTNGFSGAEVYKIQLGNNSKRKGLYFLKIDTSSQEYENSNLDISFTKVAEYVCKKLIDDYYVMLLSPAGNSSIEFNSFYSMQLPTEKIEVINNFLPNFLDESIDINNLFKGEYPAVKIFDTFLPERLKREYNLFKYMKEVFGSEDIDKIEAIDLDGVKLPNAYAYANCDYWNNKLELFECSSHGDLHGENIFFSKENHDYALIDIALYNPKGYLFYDTAYFELSMMLKDLSKSSVMEWLNNNTLVTEEKWDDAEFKGSLVVRALQGNEKKWIDELCKKNNFSYKDQLNKTRYVARVLAGLNFASKRNVSDDIRIKSIIYASLNLKRLLDKYDGSEYSKVEAIKWFPTTNMHDQEKAIEVKNLAEFTDNFTGDQAYILLLSDKELYKSDIIKNIARIHFLGVISLGDNDEIKKEFDSLIYTKALYNVVEDVQSVIEGNTCWWLYMDGIKSIPETVSHSPGEWRNNNIRFLQKCISSLEKNIAPNEITIIVDAKSFYSDRWEYLQKILEEFDYIKKIQVNVILLNQRPDYTINEKLLCNISYKKFELTLEDLAIYCNKFMKNITASEIIIPTINMLGKALDEDDKKYILSHLTIVHDQIVEDNLEVENNSSLSFFRGDDITWAAIAQNLYIQRKEMDDIQYEIKNLIASSQLDQVVYNLPHLPGSGATIIARVVCWKLRNDFPTVIINKIDESLAESFKILGTYSGKHLLILLDGDFYKNDIEKLKGILKGQRLKACILYSFRTYDISENVLGILEYEEGLEFAKEYKKKMNILMNYSQEEMEKRVGNMEKLAGEESLREFRLPFFFGMNAFEADFKGIVAYIDDIVSILNEDESMKKLINYISIISYYTASNGLNYKYAEKILGKKYKSARKLLIEINDKFHNLIYSQKTKFRICHPIVAYKILTKQFNFESEAYKNLVCDFLRELKKFDGNSEVSDTLNDLFMDIFIKRDTLSEIEIENKKKSFSQIVLDLKNENLQESIYEILVELFPKNPYYLQHYGRFIISNHPENMMTAKEYFDLAIKYDENNSSHYHARGDMYFKHVVYMIKFKYRELTAEEIYNQIVQPIDAAFKDFEKAIEIVNQSIERINGLLYPYSSIVQTSTFIVTQLVNKANQREHYKDFLMKKNSMSKWCDSIICKAEMFDMDTEYRFEYIRENDFYSKTRKNLIKFQFNQEELLNEIKANPNDENLKRAYISTVEPKITLWETKTQGELSTIYQYCEDLICTNSFITEGMLWKWYHAYIRIKNFKYTHILGLLETQQDLESNLTVNFLLYTTYFCKYMQTGNIDDANQTSKYIEICKKLSNKENKQTYTQWYYTDEGDCPISFEKKGTKIAGTVIGNCQNSQSEYLTIDSFSKFRAFFVPKHTRLKKDQSFGVHVKFYIGFSYDGLRAWEVDIIE